MGPTQADFKYAVEIPIPDNMKRKPVEWFSADTGKLLYTLVLRL